MRTQSRQAQEKEMKSATPPIPCPMFKRQLLRYAISAPTHPHRNSHLVTNQMHLPSKITGECLSAQFLRNCLWRPCSNTSIYSTKQNQHHKRRQLKEMKQNSFPIRLNIKLIPYYYFFVSLSFSSHS